MVDDLLPEDVLAKIINETRDLENLVPSKTFVTTHGSKLEWRIFPNSSVTLRQVASELAAEIVCSRVKQLLDVDDQNNLRFDPTFDGGGYVVSPPSSFLGYHTDFNFSSSVGMYRVANLIFYLNPGYQSSFGGCLHLLDRNSKTVEKVIEPRLNRLVGFITNDESVHGVSLNLADFSRRSLNSYYYSPKPISSAQSMSPHKTLWRQ